MPKFSVVFNFLQKFFWFAFAERRPSATASTTVPTHQIFNLGKRNIGI